MKDGDKSEQEQVTPSKALAATNPMQLLDKAVAAGASVDALEKLMDMYERWKATEARMAFDEAMAAFKSNPPTLEKTRHVSYKNRDGTFTEYDHGDLSEMAEKVGAAMAPHGLSFRWRTEQTDDKRVSVTCIIAHRMGHSTETTLVADPDNSGGKNSIQQVGSTVTYLQRYTMLAATGLAVRGQDDDGRGAEDAPLIDEKQAAAVRDWLSTLERDEADFLQWLGQRWRVDLEAVEHMTVPMYEDAIRAFKRWHSGAA